MATFIVHSPFLRWAKDNEKAIKRAVKLAEKQMSRNDPRRVGIYWTIARQLYDARTLDGGE